MDTPEQIAERIAMFCPPDYRGSVVDAALLALTAERQRAEAAGRERDELAAYNTALRKVLEMGTQLNLSKFLNWIAERLIKVYRENPNIDYIISLRERAMAAEEALSTTPAASLDALTQRVRAEAMEEAALWVAEVSDGYYVLPNNRKQMAAAIRQRAQEGK